MRPHILHQLFQECKKPPEKLRILTDLTGQNTGNLFVKKVNEYAETIEPKVIQKAIVGITCARKILSNGINVF